MADPNKWLGLMKWSMKYTDGTAPTSFKQMPDEDRQFLEKVLKEAVIDETERIGHIIRILNGEHPSVVFASDDDSKEDQEQLDVSEEDLAEYKDVLMDELLTRIDQIDNAMNFIKLEGLPVLMKLMKENPRASTRALAAEVCSVVVQNNPFSQNAAMEAGVLEVLCGLVKDADTTCQVKALLAISCLVRHHELATARFLSSSCQGLQILHEFLAEQGDLRLQQKSLFLLRYLVRVSKAIARKVVDEQAYLATLTSLISHEDIDLCESSLEALNEIVAMGKEFATLCKADELGLMPKLSARVKEITQMKDDDEDKQYMSEIARMASELLNLLSAS